MVSPEVVGIGSEYFVVDFRVYIDYMFVQYIITSLLQLQELLST